MDKEYMILIVSQYLKTIREDKQFSQEKMANMIGISKKKLVQIEKKRTFLNWTTTIAVCSLFREHPLLREKIGSDPMEIIELIADDLRIQSSEKTLGGVVFWKNLYEYKGFKLQKNVLSTHFRILDEDNYRVISTFNESVVKEKWQEIQKII